MYKYEININIRLVIRNLKARERILIMLFLLKNNKNKNLLLSFYSEKTPKYIINKLTIFISPTKKSQAKTEIA